jgi:cytochrome c-type biogenesis protein CcmE
MIGFEEGKTYYRTCDEVAAMGTAAVGAKLKLAGVVEDGSIRRDGDILHFTLSYEGSTYPVQYVGTDPVPDTFKDGVEAVVDGVLNESGVFVGQKIQAKCASKYEADYGDEEAEHPDQIDKTA